MGSRASAFWVRFKAKRWAYTFTILATLTVGILVATIASSGVKGKEGQKWCDATPLTIPSPQKLSNQVSDISVRFHLRVVNINTDPASSRPQRTRARPP